MPILADDVLPTVAILEWPSLLDEHEVTYTNGVGLVVRLNFASPSNNLAVKRVLNPVFDGNYNGLFHLVAHHVTTTGLAVVAGLC